MERILDQSKWKTILLAGVGIFLALVLVLYPEEGFRSSVRGLKIWWDVVFPSLLPFFITAELLMGFGVVHLMGVLLEPLMRPLFRVPGAGAFVVAVALISGNPMGSKLSTRLREQKLLTQAEGERLVCFTSTSGPLFIFGAVAVGFFENAKLGLVLATIHYISTITVGLCMRFYRSDDPPSPQIGSRRENLFIRAMRAMHRARIKDGRPIGQLLGEAVTSAVQTLLMIGGFIIIFSVFVHLLTYVGITKLFSIFLAFLFQTFSIPATLADPSIAGIFEMTLGSQVVSEPDVQASIFAKIVLVSAFLAWNGFSIHAQVASVLAKSDIRYKPYLFARILHVCFAIAFTFLLWPILDHLVTEKPTSITVFWNTTGETSTEWRTYQYLCLIVFLLGIFYRFFTSKGYQKTTTR
ncbi:sporulation integral membrane protein YlbJ [Risungbinella massiliensis]|uniref:sporulation integral membrane protein YlbJ n=1 Tax=Risungbinella massiliensis TaxID=1329796 RepID=UPI00069BA7D7|nr:sporulation integral membrane protein YlbJ [Risungbinella massiliensis]